MKLTTKQVAAAFGVSFQTVVNYTERKNDALPCHVERRGLVRELSFDSADVRDWAKRHGIPYQEPRPE